jgi:hypothetical protein
VHQEAGNNNNNFNESRSGGDGVEATMAAAVSLVPNAVATTMAVGSVTAAEDWTTTKILQQLQCSKK